VRQGLPVNQDVYGNPLTAKTDPLSNLANPFRPSDSKTNEVKSEVTRLHNADPENGDLQVTPTPINKKVTIDGTPIKLDDKQKYELQKAIGQKTQQAWSQLIKTPEYQALDDQGKAKALTGLKQDAVKVAQREYAAKHNVGPFSADAGQLKALTAKQQALSEGNVDVSKYTTSSTAKTSKTSVPKVPAAPKVTETVYNPKNKTWVQTNKTTGKVTQVTEDGTRTVVEPGIGNLKNARPDYTTHIRSIAPKYNVDANAVMAVAAMEGLGGGVGDNGTSYGPFQLHVGGALPQGKDQAWAESQEGIDYALQQISKVAGGLKGEAAIEAIVRNFERPLDPDNEVAGAVSVYNGKGKTLGSGPAGSTTSKAGRKTTGTTTATRRATGTKRTATPKIAAANFKLPKLRSTHKTSIKAPTIAKGRLTVPRKRPPKLSKIA
jgi:hypothetical protein